MTFCGVAETLPLIAKIWPVSLATSICAAARLVEGPITNALVVFATMPVMPAPTLSTLLGGENFDGEPFGATTETMPVPLFAIQKELASRARPHALTRFGFVI